MKNLTNSTAIVTGTSRGIGPYIARSLAKEGMNLVLAARSSGDLENVAEEIRMIGAQVLAVKTDMTSLEDLEHLVRTAEQEFGAVDVLVNNAGGDPQREFHMYAPNEIEQVVRLNLTGPMTLTRLVMTRMLERNRGHIVNISSLGGRLGFPHSEAYSASKDGLVGFTRVLRSDYRSAGVSASALILGTIKGDGATPRTAMEVGIELPRSVTSFASPPEAVGKAVVKAIKRDKAEIVVTPGPGRLMKALMDFFPSMGPRMNHMSGVTSIMKRVAEHREAEHSMSVSQASSVQTSAD